MFVSIMQESLLKRSFYYSHTYRKLQFSVECFTEFWALVCRYQFVFNKEKLYLD